jgi:hypothetical protein
MARYINPRQNPYTRIVKSKRRQSYVNKPAWPFVSVRILTNGLIWPDVAACLRHLASLYVIYKRVAWQYQASLEMPIFFKSAIHVMILSANLQYAEILHSVLLQKSFNIPNKKSNEFYNACQNKLSNKRHFAFFSLKNGIIRIFFIFCWLLVYVLSKIVIEKKLGITMLLFLTTHKAIRYFKVYFIRVHVLPQHELYVFPRLP